MLDALSTLSLLADGDDPSNNTFGLGKPAPGTTIVAFKEFEVRKNVIANSSYIKWIIKMLECCEHTACIPHFRLPSTRPSEP